MRCSRTISGRRARAARPERSILFKHALRNALIPFVTSVGIMTGYLLGGAIVVEQVFAIPGLGRLILGAIAERNYPLLQATILLVTFAFVLVNFIVDLLYAVIDPRVRHERCSPRPSPPRRRLAPPRSHRRGHPAGVLAAFAP